LKSLEVIVNLSSYFFLFSLSFVLKLIIDFVGEFIIKLSFKLLIEIIINYIIQILINDDLHLINYYNERRICSKKSSFKLKDNSIF